MKKSMVWTLKPSAKSKMQAAEFAATTLPWTFNRMGYSYKVQKMTERAFNIVKGIVAQEMLKEALQSKGFEPEMDNSYRTSDQFDFLINNEGHALKIDLKTMNHYNDYAIERPPFSLELIEENKSYGGPDWRYFFPMLMPHNQIQQQKDVYCFGISSSVDFRKCAIKDRSDFYICSFPYESFFEFYSSKKLCEEREKVGKGYFIELSFISNSLYPKSIDVTILGTWNGLVKKETVTVHPNIKKNNVGPFSMISAFHISKEDYDNLNNTLLIDVCKNDFTSTIRNAKKKLINVQPPTPMTFTKKEFCNLILPDGYTMYLLGWISREDFLKECRKYKSWVWPLDKKDKFSNQPWSQITVADLEKISKLGFENCIKKQPTEFNAGWMKGMPFSGSASCYVYPNMMRGGLQETNLYILPSDLKDLNLLFQK